MIDQVQLIILSLIGGISGRFIPWLALSVPSNEWNSVLFWNTSQRVLNISQVSKMICSGREPVEVQLMRREVDELQAAMKHMSMVDEFAAYTRRQRRLHKLQGQLRSTGEKFVIDR